MLIPSAFALAQTEGGQSVQGGRPAVEEGRPAQADADRLGPQPFALPVRIVEEPDEANRARKRDDDASQHEKDDLIEQRRAASAAIRSAASAERQEDLTLAQAVIAGLGTIGLIAALALTIQSNRAAIRAAEAADRSVAITQQNARDELRAYVAFIPRGLRHSGTNLYFVVDLVNFGSTPATNVRVSFAGEKIVYPIPDAGHLPRLTQLRGTRTLAPGVESRIHFRHNGDISDRHLHEFRESNSPRFTFAGRVEYTDIYGAKRWVEACWNHRYGEGDWKAMKIDVRETGLEYAAYGNESDNIHREETERASRSAGDVSLGSITGPQPA